MKATQHLTKVVLVEPAGNLNVGSVARLCENFGIMDLRLVSPKCDLKAPETRNMAVKGKNVLENAKVYPSLLSAISDCTRVIATCGRKEHGSIPLHQSEETFKWFHSIYSEKPAALVFGREDRGLTNQELLFAHKIISLDTSKDYPSMNLSHAVAIVLNEWNRYRYLEINLKSRGINNSPAPVKQLEDCLDDLSEVLLEIGFLMEHTQEARMSKFKSLLQRAEVKSEEVALIRGVVRQMKWSLENH